MLERGKMDRGVIEIVDTESLVPKDHLLRKIDAAVDFNRLYEMVEPLYSEDNGRPSVDPVVLFKMVLIQHLYVLPLVLGIYTPRGNAAFFHGEL
mgnify:CR=1 FL=1